MNRLIVLSRSARSFAYGAFGVVFAQGLTARGLGAVTIGIDITLALLAGALVSAFTGRMVRAFGTRATLAGSGIAMIVAAFLLDGFEPSVVVGCLLGVVSPGGQDVGTFAAIEQTVLVADDDTAHFARRLSLYNVASALALAFGALAAAVVPYRGVLLVYALAGIVVTLVASQVPDARPIAVHERTLSRRSFGVVERLAALFAVDAFAGGFVVQAFLAYWFEKRYGVGPEAVGPLLFAANLLAAASYLLAERVARRIGLLETMVFTHLPSNVLLCAVPFMPTFPLAAAVLLARFALSQMDVPVRQAYTLSLVPADDRARAAGITAAVRPAAAAIAPVLAGVAFGLSTFGLPFVIAGTMKIVYDLVLYRTFRSVPATERGYRTR